MAVWLTVLTWSQLGLTLLSPPVKKQVVRWLHTRKQPSLVEASQHPPPVGVYRSSRHARGLSNFNFLWGLLGLSNFNFLWGFIGAVPGPDGDALCMTPTQCKVAVRCHDPATTATTELHDQGALFHANLLAHGSEWANLFQDGQQTPLLTRWQTC